MAFATRAGFLLMVAFAATGAAAQTMPESCQKDFVPMMQKRQGYIEEINGFRKKKPTAAKACNVFKSLADQNKKVTDWMTAQKDWCQVPDDMLNSVTEAQKQIEQARGNACGAAAKQAAQIRQMQRQQQQGGGRPAAGSGVRLPQGAL